RVVFNDTQLVVEVLTVAAQFVVDDGLGALVALDAFTGEHLHVDHGADHARGHAQRSVLHVGRLFTEDGAQQFFFRRELGFALRGHLADQHVIGTDFRPDIHDAGIVQTVQLGFREVADVAGDFLRPELGVTRDDGQFLDMDRGVAVVCNDLLGNKDGVLEVVAVPGHEGDQHVLTEGQFAQVGRRAVSQHVTTCHQVAAIHDRALIDVGVLVGTGVLGEVVNIHTDFTGDVFVIVHTNHDTLGVDVVHHAAATRLHRGAGVDGHRALDAGADQRLFRTQAGYGLTLHVGAHQSPVRVVVLEEGNQRCGHGHDLRRSNVHVVNVFRRGHERFTSLTASHQVVDKTAFFVELRV